MSASKVAIKRLQKEYKAHQADPPPFVWAKPNEANLLEWHYIFRGPPETPYDGGEYWGTIVFPKDYPFAPPALRMMTPSGRFEPNKSICTSMSEYHPGSWNVAWSVDTILVGLLSFMLSDEITTGAVKHSDSERKSLATKSHAWNAAQPKFRTLFPEYAGERMKDLPNMSGKAPEPAGPQREGKAPPGQWARHRKMSGTWLLDGPTASGSSSSPPDEVYSLSLCLRRYVPSR
ncbi:hypothetical protein B0A53_04853 [Rhodotorula sp. CCFEE 5036]|nr:hypothetical protein B0A53_04853 [Rhodotorula sp. CCFEE 5036]